MGKNKPYISNKTVAYNGAMLAIAAVFGYSIIVMLYVIIRSSLTIHSIMPKGERNTILWINGFSVAYSVVIFSLLMTVVSSLAGAVAAVVLKKLSAYFNPSFNLRKANFISIIIASIMLLLLYLLLYALLEEKMTIVHVETFLFWFLFPAVIFFVVCVMAANRLNKWLLYRMQEKIVVANEFD
jgi:hypothetical protein